MDLKAFNKILAKEVSRKEFLTHIGIIILAVTGVAGIIRTAKNPHLLSQSKNKEGFGSGSYGGTRKEKA